MPPCKGVREKEYLHLAIVIVLDRYLYLAVVVFIPFKVIVGKGTTPCLLVGLQIQITPLDSQSDASHYMAERCSRWICVYQYAVRLEYELAIVGIEMVNGSHSQYIDIVWSIRPVGIDIETRLVVVYLVILEACHKCTEVLITDWVER